MKLRVVIDVDVSKTLAETMQRNGFSAKPDGTALKIEIPNSPIIPKRKTKVAFIENPTEKMAACVDGSYSKLVELLKKFSDPSCVVSKEELQLEAQQLLTSIG